MSLCFHNLHQYLFEIPPTIVEFEIKCEPRRIRFQNRCKVRPPATPREETQPSSSVAVPDSTGGTSSRADEKETCVELRVPSDKAGELWKALFRNRATLEVGIQEASLLCTRNECKIEWITAEYTGLGMIQG